jgi:hypothetical protein
LTQSVGVAAIGRITTTAQAASAKTVLDEIGHSTTDCPSLNGTLTAQQTTLLNCVVYPTNDNEEAVSHYENIIKKLNDSIP